MCQNHIFITSVSQTVHFAFQCACIYSYTKNARLPVLASHWFPAFAAVTLCCDSGDANNADVDFRLCKAPGEAAWGRTWGNCFFQGSTRAVIVGELLLLPPGRCLGGANAARVAGDVAVADAIFFCTLFARSDGMLKFGKFQYSCVAISEPRESQCNCAVQAHNSTGLLQVCMNRFFLFCCNNVVCRLMHQYRH